MNRATDASGAMRCGRDALRASSASRSRWSAANRSRSSRAAVVGLRRDREIGPRPGWEGNGRDAFQWASWPISETAEIVCLTSDALVANRTGFFVMLIRTGLKPYSLEIVRDPVAVRSFLVEPRYVGESSVD